MFFIIPIGSSYETAVKIIGDPAKRNPATRQSADHSMVYIISTLLRRASEQFEYLNSLQTSKYPKFEKVRRSQIE